MLFDDENSKSKSGRSNYKVAGYVGISILFFIYYYYEYKCCIQFFNSGKKKGILPFFLIDNYHYKLYIIDSKFITLYNHRYIDYQRKLREYFSFLIVFRTNSFFEIVFQRRLVMSIRVLIVDRQHHYRKGIVAQLREENLIEVVSDTGDEVSTRTLIDIH